MSSYFKFNNWVFNYYLDNCIPFQLNSLSIPVSEIDNFIYANNMNLNGFREINNSNWSNLLRVHDGKPQYFGLIALQCLAAYKMQNSNEVNAGNFRDHFTEIIGLNDVNHFNTFCSEDFNNDYKVQEKIWFSAKEFLGRKNILLDIPEVGEHAGRYTRFPKSQIILNQEDLKEYKQFFNKVHEKFDCISFEDFKKYYLNNILIYRNTFRRTNNTKNDTEWSDIERKIKIKQIFDFYCSNEWMNIIDIENNGNDNSIKSYIIKFSENKLSMYDENFNLLESLNTIISHHRFMFFKESIDYPNEYVSVNSTSSVDNNILLIYNSPSNRNEIRELTNLFPTINYENSNHNIVIFKITDLNKLPSFLQNKLTSLYPIKLIGFKISGKKQYLVTHPPQINCLSNISYQIFHEKQRIMKSEMNKTGKYYIKVNGFSNFYFELIDSPRLEHSSNFNITKLHFKTLNYTETLIGCINGFQINYEDTNTKELLTINNWIKSLEGIKNNSENKLLKSISLSKYGKYSKNIRNN